MRLLRTPEERFVGLPDYDFEPQYRVIRDGDGTEIRIHAVDQGTPSASPILLLHGEPSWCFLYRHMIRGLAKAGHRVLAPDLVGFGRSDKPAEQSDYTYERHVDWMSAWLEAYDLHDVTMFAQDWGGLIGLRLVARFPDRFARVVIANTGLPIGIGANDAFKRWLEFSQTTPTLRIGNIVKGGTVRGLSNDEIVAYDAPFPDDSYKAGARRFPALVPYMPNHASVAENTAAWEVLKRFDKPFLTAFSDSDPITAGGEAVFHKLVPGTKGQSHVTITEAGHFLQEDKPLELVELIDGFIRNTR
jgi:haloalkane dehalogenase